MQESQRGCHTYSTPSHCQLGRSYSSPSLDRLPPPPTVRHPPRLSLPARRLLLGWATPVGLPPTPPTPGPGTSMKRLRLCQSQVASRGESARARGHIFHVLLRCPRRLHQQSYCAQVCAPPDLMQTPRGHRERQQLRDDRPTLCGIVHCV